MELSFKNRYYVYIATNTDRSALEIGISGNLNVYLEQLKQISTDISKSICNSLLYWEQYDQAEQAIDREKKLNRLSRKKKEELIHKHNPEWKFLNEEIEHPRFNSAVK